METGIVLLRMANDTTFHIQMWDIDKELKRQHDNSHKGLFSTICQVYQGFK